MMSELTEKLLTSEPAYLGKLINLYVDMVELPNGHQSEREIVRHPGAVAMVPIKEDGQVIMIRQYRHAARSVLLEIPAGTLDGDEDPRDAASRELQEEIGCKPGRLEPLGREFTAPGYTTEMIHLFLATGLETSHLEHDTDEFIEVVTLPLEEALRRVYAGEINDGKTMLGLLLAAHRLGR
jgi:ADP-ribose pyrophosphatase